jgi:hypothetical protein
MTKKGLTNRMPSFICLQISNKSGVPICIFAHVLHPNNPEFEMFAKRNIVDRDE